jgi:predicted RNA binding protein YcfA (HicA-like mRNA interferase family)
MSKREKRLQKLRQNPKNVSLDEIRQVLEAEGFELDHVTGSHYIFRAEAGNEILTVVIPFRRPVKPVYVKQVLTAVEKWRQVVEVEEEVDDDGEDD